MVCQFSVQQVKCEGLGLDCAAMGGRPRNMSALGRHIFLVVYVAIITLPAVSGEKNRPDAGVFFFRLFVSH